MQSHRNRGMYRYSERTQPYCIPSVPSTGPHHIRPPLRNITNYVEAYPTARDLSHQGQNPHSSLMYEPGYFDQGYYPSASYTEPEFNQFAHLPIPEFELREYQPHLNTVPRNWRDLTSQSESNPPNLKIQMMTLTDKPVKASKAHKMLPEPKSTFSLKKESASLNTYNQGIKMMDLKDNPSQFFGSQKKNKFPEPKSKILSNIQSSKSNEIIKFPLNTVDEKIQRLFSGNVKNILSWSKLKDKSDILFEVIGLLVKISQGRSPAEKLIPIRDNGTGPVLNVIFYEMDTKLPYLKPNNYIKCVGVLKSSNRFQAFKVINSSANEYHKLERVTNLCNRVAQEIINGK